LETLFVFSLTTWFSLFSDIFRRIIDDFKSGVPYKNKDTDDGSNPAMKLTQLKGSLDVMISYNWTSGRKIAEKVLFN